MSNGAGLPTRCVLLLQNDPDETRIIMAALQQSGFDVAGPFGGVTPVHEYIAADQPDLAILDTATTDGVAFQVAGELKDRGIPFLFYSRWDELDGVPSEFRDASFIEKPTSPTLLTKVVTGIVERWAIQKKR